jgi:hypothetical protein
MADLNLNQPTRIGYYVFDLPSGEVLDTFNAEPVVLPDNFEDLTPRYVERRQRWRFERHRLRRRQLDRPEVISCQITEVKTRHHR